MPIMSSQCTVISKSHTQHDLTLYRFGASLSTDFLTQDVQMLKNVSGVIVTANWSLSFLKKRKPLDLFKQIKDDPDSSGVAWARSSNLPFVIVLIKQEAETPSFSVDDLFKGFDLYPSTPIIVCSTGLDREQADVILSTAVEYFGGA